MPRGVDHPPVVLIHGLWLSGWAMALVARRLRRCGFRPYLFSYPSMRRTLREAAAALRAFGDAIEGEMLHFVGHSLGGVVIQAMLAYCPPPRRGRVVTLSSPHLGSYAAKTLAGRFWGPPILGMGIADLLRGELPPCDLSRHEVGVIKGDRPIGLGRLFVRFEGPNDGVVALDEMRLLGAADEITLNVSHTGMLLSRDVAASVCRFLRFGRFAQSG